jgi:uncharacterized protein (TIGR02118 family)
MLKLLLVLYKHPDLEWETFQRRWSDIEQHALAQVPGVRHHKYGYRQPDPGDRARRCDAIAELWFDTPEALHVSLASEVGQAALARLANVLEGQTFKLMVQEEQP